MLSWINGFIYTTILIWHWQEKWINLPKSSWGSTSNTYVGVTISLIRWDHLAMPWSWNFFLNANSTISKCVLDLTWCPRANIDQNEINRKKFGYHIRWCIKLWKHIMEGAGELVHIKMLPKESKYLWVIVKVWYLFTVNKRYWHTLQWW
jgi:hypothetical protein